jgi:FlaA1/EpsC-like NDP-sugar epimerase
VQALSMLNCSWFISGVCGTIGRKLLEKVLELSPKQVIGLDNNESELFSSTRSRRKIRSSNYIPPTYTNPLSG